MARARRASLGARWAVLFVIAALGSGGCAQMESVHAANAGCKGATLLPDIVAEVPSRLSIVPGEVPSQFFLIFRTTVHNAGPGPLRIVGQRASRAQSNLDVHQVVACAAGGTKIVYRAGVMGYENEPTHHHWHYLGFERYTLMGRSPGTPTAHTRKAGFCLTDDYDTGLALPGKPRAPIFQEPGNACAAGQPGALYAEAGISVGWADEYEPYREGQYVDVTHLPAGEYRLLNQPNSRRLLMESRYDNGVAGVGIRLSRPHGPRNIPALTILGTCLGEAACRA